MDNLCVSIFVMRKLRAMSNLWDLGEVSRLDLHAKKSSENMASNFFGQQTLTLHWRVWFTQAKDFIHDTTDLTMLWLYLWNRFTVLGAMSWWITFSPVTNSQCHWLKKASRYWVQFVTTEKIFLIAWNLQRKRNAQQHFSFRPSKSD